MKPMFKTPSRTPTEPSHIEILASSSTNIYFGAYPNRDSATTLVGDLSLPRSSKAKSPQSISSQKATRETPEPAPRPYPTTPTISARKKPVCKTCGTPRKGHKRGTCAPSTPPPDECKPLYASSPEKERTASALAESWAMSLKTPTQSTSAISSVITAVSASVKRRPIHGACGLPMKGHKRQNGVLVCPSDQNQDTSVSSLRIKAPKGMDQEPSYLDSPSDRWLHKDHLVHCLASVNHNHGRSTTPTLTPVHVSSNAQIKHVGHVSPIGDRSRSESPNPFVSSDSLYSSVSTFAPSIAFDPQSTAAMPSINALNDALGEPALVIYPAWSRDEVSQIRQRAKALHFFNGVVNVKIEEKDGLDLAHAIKKGNADDHGVSSSHYMKWVIVSEKKEMVQKCIDLCAKRPLEL